jgi:glycosyltransferase involved in cell wall biosynthesis/2-polyprenyl-3-methyl-5-hydroxy-6-metoxy-1,4-benzoquinol methylase
MSTPVIPRLDVRNPRRVSRRPARPKVVITMPAYQAEMTLEQTVLAIPAGVADELILVDDASRDGTADLARRLGLQVHVHPVNRGYGANQKSCYSHALASEADIVVMLHPDYQYEPKAVPLLIAPILAGDADMTFGSRFAGMGDPLGGGMPHYRYFGNRIVTSAQNLMLGTRFTDMHSGMRAYTRACLESLPFRQYSEGFAFDAEFLVDAVTSGQRVVEVPIPTRYTKESSSISVLRSLAYVWRGTVYAARRAMVRGRRGGRYLPGWKRPRRAKGKGPLTKVLCISCGGRMHLRYPATTAGDVPMEEFRCTTSALGIHDDILECSRCGLLSSAPTLLPDEIVARYEEVVDEEYLAEEEERRELFGWVTEQMDGYYVPGRSLLEIGSNMGLFLAVAKERGWDAAGIEPSAWAVEQGRERFGVDLRQGAIETLDVDPGSVDALVMLDVLEHLADPAKALRRMRPMMAEQSVLALATVNVEGLHGRLRGGDWPWFIRSHLHYFRPATLTKMLSDAGFEAVQWSVVPRSFHMSYLLHRAAGVLPGSKLAETVVRLGDPKIPVGWIGDVTLTIARPR